MDTWLLNITDNGQVGPQDGIMAIMNMETVLERRVEIREISLTPVGGWATTASATLLGVGHLTISRISASSGGTSKDFIKHDTSNTTLPSAVSVVTNPSSVTLVSTLRRVCDCPNREFSTLSMAQKMFMRRGLNTSYIVYQMDDADVQDIVMREGEGIAVTQSESSVPHKYRMVAVITNLSSSETYKTDILDCNYGIPGAVLFSLVNGSGSGVVLSVKFVMSVEIGPIGGGGAQGAGVMRLAYIDDVDGGTLVSPIAVDSGVQPLYNISCYNAPFNARLAGTRVGVPQDWQSTNGALATVIVQHEYGTYRTFSNPVRAYDANTALAATNSPELHPQSCLLYKAGNGRPGILLRPGQGIALLSGASGNIDNVIVKTFNINVFFTHVLGPAPDASGLQPAPSKIKEIFGRPSARRSLTFT